jgi:type I restriction enzyme M protein
MNLLETGIEKGLIRFDEDLNFITYIQSEKSAIQTAFTDKVNLLKEELTEKYFTAKQNDLDDYPIFMAIAEDIGYDATGRSTANNELIEIGKELSKFIIHINKTEP